MYTGRYGYSGNAFDVDQLVDDAVWAENAGFDVFQIVDLPGALSPLIALSAVARATSKITLGPYVLNSALWNPKTVIRDLATLDRISNGRLEIALGSGIAMPNTRDLMPPTPDARFDRLRETVEAITTARSEPGITPGFVGPARVALAGTVSRVLELAAAEADIFLIASVPPIPKVDGLASWEVIPERAATERYLRRLDEYGRGRTHPLEIGTSATVVVTDDTDGALAELAEKHPYLTPEQIRESPKMLIGNATDIAGQILERHDNLGITYYALRAADRDDLIPVLDAVGAKTSAASSV